MANKKIIRFKAGHVIHQLHVEFLIKKLGATKKSATHASLSQRRNFIVGKKISAAGAKTLNSVMESIAGPAGWLPGACSFPPDADCLKCVDGYDALSNPVHTCGKPAPPKKTI